MNITLLPVVELKRYCNLSKITVRLISLCTIVLCLILNVNESKRRQENYNIAHIWQTLALQLYGNICTLSLRRKAQLTQ